MIVPAGVNSKSYNKVTTMRDYQFIIEKSIGIQTLDGETNDEGSCVGSKPFMGSNYLMPLCSIFLNWFSQRVPIYYKSGSIIIIVQ